MNERPLDRVFSALRARGIEPRPAGDGFACRCPAHDDANPSLSIAEGADGRALLHCHAGCTSEAIVGALGLRARDLFAPRDAPPLPRRAASGNGRAARTFATARDAVAELERTRGKRSATWTYRDANGAPVMVVARWNTAGSKTFRPVARVPSGQWIIGDPPGALALYNLPALLAAKPGERVYIAEGEKAADALAQLGLTATTSAHGAKSAARTDWGPLAGRDVVSLPDRDDAGERYAAEAARLALAAGAASVRVVKLWDNWTGLPPGGDAADVIDHCRTRAAAWAKEYGGTVEDALAEELDSARASIEALADLAKPVDLGALPMPGVPPRGASTPKREPPAPFRPFPVRRLPRVLASFVDEAATAIGCDPVSIALPLLIASAAAIGNTRQIFIKNAWREPAILWGAIVAYSGDKKSPGRDAALKPIFARQVEAMRRCAERMREHEEKAAVYERDHADWKRRKRDHPPSKPVEPTPEEFWTAEATTEAVAMLLRDNPRGILVAPDELATWFGGFNRYTPSGVGADAARWIEVFHGRPLKHNRKTGPTRLIYVRHAAASVFGTIQPDRLRAALTPEHRASGLAARLLLVFPPRRIVKWTEADVSAESERQVDDLFGNLFALTPDIDEDGEARPRVVRMTAEAKARWVEFYNAHAIEQADLEADSDLAKTWSKLEAYAARLALVFHLARRAGGEPIDPDLIDAASMEGAIDLTRWFGNESRRVYAMLDEGEGDAAARRLVDLIHRKGGELSGRELVQSSRAFRTVEEAEAALSRLAESGVGTWETPEQRGPGQPRARRFVLNAVYGVNVYRNPAADPASGNTVDVDGVDTPESAPPDDLGAGCSDWPGDEEGGAG